MFEFSFSSKGNCLITPIIPINPTNGDILKALLPILGRKEELDAKYDIPRDYQKKEGWVDDWHYTEIETPKEHGIYYCIHYGFKSDFYNYTYMAWAYGHWWAYAGYGEKWLLVRGKSREWMKPFAWVTVPDLYYRTDHHHQFLCEHFVSKEDWEYEEKINNIRKERGCKHD